MKTPTIVTSTFLLAIALTLGAQPSDTMKLKPSFYEVNDYVDENENCLKCHGETKYSYSDADWGKTLIKTMYPDLIVDRDAYYDGVHRSFMCSDCHMGDFEEFPHTLDARMEENFACIDCHGYDETYAKYHFEEIDAEFTESIHHIDGFTCWKCHDPHSYKPNIRSTKNIKDAIKFDNAICLNCHGNFNNYNLLTDREEINLVEKHDWLPNQVAHLSSVRCIECHTEVNDSILVAHKILPMNKAVKRCTECHSRDSRLMHTLYKFQSKEDRKAGFVNGVILNDTFVIGANPSPLLDILSIAVFCLTFLAIGFHTILRIIKLRK